MMTALIPDLALKGSLIGMCSRKSVGIGAFVDIEQRSAGLYELIIGDIEMHYRTVDQRSHTDVIRKDFSVVCARVGVDLPMTISPVTKCRRLSRC